MKEFSEYLFDYVTDRNISWQAAAKLCDVDRTSLRRYASGKKSPENMDKVLKIAKGLGMSGRQTEEFGTLYEISKIGRYQYLAQELIDQIFCGQRIRQKSSSIGREYSTGGWQDVLVGRLCGQEEICGAFSYIVQDASDLYVKMNFDEKSRCLFQILAECASDCRIEHIIEINNISDRETELEEFGNLLPFLASKKDYKIYCHYRWCREEPEVEERMYMVLSSKGLALFSADMTDGIFASQREYQEYYQEMFLNSLRECRIYGGSGNHSDEVPDDVREEYRVENSSSGVSFTYQNLPHECIWVQKKGEEPVSFYLKEVELVKSFKEYMKCGR